MWPFQMDLSTMESRRTPGLFLAGEIVNVDGITGGFNFQVGSVTACPSIAIFPFALH